MGRSVARDHEAKRAAILKSAAQVFARDGIAGASMAAVAAEAGMSKGVLYHYWDGKEALLFEILDTYLAALRDVVCADHESLGALCEEVLFAYHGMDAEHRIQAEGMGILPPERAEVLRGHQRAMVAALADRLRAIAPDLKGRSLRAATMSVFGMLNWFYMWNPGADRDARRDYAATVAQITTGGVGALRAPPTMPGDANPAV
ncbi:HTH-type transcriptional repressor KstR2 [Jannaschia seosinensis]|uniref:HTH-type transcriptional repressor KstR2 n=1 Tax=Jannaschia seosinensis TaxID=313367 RepID=A0A0M7B8G4_9RHOB|nr:TetR family transcriptional regulator [Jannaschia seosinensis]CUH39010.1 HTH-type transcriptional repressor KstR2 [Jannaschia seosinensis]